MTPEAIVLALALFTMRVINYSISTIRLVFIARGFRIFAAVMAFFEAFIFAVVMAYVLADLNNIINLMAYCLGASVGSYVGMSLETRFITSYSTVTVIAQHMGTDIATALRSANYGVTVTYGEGKDGQVAILRSSTVNRDVPTLLNIVHNVNPDAFIDVESARAIRRGWLPGGPPRR